MDDKLDTEGGMDRRSVLKKAAVAGAIAWSVPTLTSSRTLAAGFCTPKCYPKAGSGTVKPFVFCLPGNNGAKWVRVITSAPVATCPCESSGPAKLISATFGTFTGNPTPVVYQSGATADGNLFFILKGPGEGALGQGTYSATVTVTSECLDRDKTKIRQTCNYTVSFNFQPNNGSCEGSSTVGAGTITLGSCNPIVCVP